MSTIPQRILGEALIRSAQSNPPKSAIFIKDKAYTYAELLKTAQQIASHLISNGVEKGDRVAVYMNNSWYCVASIYGIIMAGGVFLVINPQTKANKLQFILNDCEAKTLIADNLLKKEIIEALNDTKTIEELILAGDNSIKLNNPDIKIESIDNVISAEYNNVKFPLIIASDLAALIYTSGSTGFPKGVTMTHQSMVFTSWSLIEYLRLTDEDRILLVLPLAFDYGLYQLLMTITIGASIIIEQSFIFPATVYKHIETLKPTVFPGVPTIYAMMIETHKKTGLSFPCIKTVTNTAAALPKEFIPDLKKIFPNALIFRMYGLTECKRVCYLEPELIDIKPDSVGKAIPGTEVFLLTPDGKPVPPGESGILHIRGPHVMVGYWNKPELTNEMLKPGKIPREMVLCSNDWFKMDDEGFLYFLGRNDDIIKTRGEKVSPIEIENVIYNIPGIKEVAVIGTSDNILGEAIVAFVTAYENQNFTEKEIQNECSQHLENFMIPQQIKILKEMPKSSNGKIDKKELKNFL